MIKVDQVRDCKRLSARGLGTRAIAKELGISRNTVRTHLRGERVVREYRMEKRRAQPVRDQIRDWVQQRLEEEIAVRTPRKQLLTAARIHRLLLQDGQSASAAVVRRLVREIRLELRDPLKHAYLPLEYEAGEDAQVDFFEGVVDHVDQGRQKVFILLVRACFSGRTFAYAAPNQTREALFEGLMQAFECFEGVFPNLWFDNLTPAVKKVLRGRDRDVQGAFARFQAHYGFQAEVCSPGKGNEKGGVENQVKYSRHEILSPIPQISSRQDVQALCDQWMERDLARSARGQELSIEQLWEREAGALIPLPLGRFDASSVHPAKVSPRSWVSVGTNFYSVPVEWVGHPVRVKCDAERVTIHHKQDPPVCHPRSYGRFGMLLDLDHYLPLLRRKSRGLDRSVPFRQWIENAPPSWKVYLETMRRLLGEVSGSREFVDTLLLCRVWSEAKVSAAIEQALGHPELSLATVRYYLWKDREEDQPAAGKIHYEGPKVSEPSASSYMTLLQGSQEAEE